MSVNPQDIHVGTILHTSWGYDMTINNFCIVLDVGKTLKCQMIGTKWIQGSQQSGEGSVVPNPNDAYGKPFRLHIRKWKDKYSGKERTSLIGSYPYVKGSEEKQKGYWGIHEEGKSYAENHLD